jgi:hypothetical protein
MLICRGDGFGMDGLREMVGTIAQEFGRRTVLGRWGEGGQASYMITFEDAPAARGADFEPMVLALPDGAVIPIEESGHVATR